ncbi:MAG: hypothetical protein Q9160_002360 [Pyrenula sp. 1 TL-2023]
MAFNGENGVFSSPVGRKSGSISRDQTPSTAFTSFSPEEARLRSGGRNPPTGHAKGSVAANEHSTESVDNDPFKFTPTAEEFKPSSSTAAPTFPKAPIGSSANLNLGYGLSSLTASFARMSMVGAADPARDSALTTKQMQMQIPQYRGITSTIPRTNHLLNQALSSVKPVPDAVNLSYDQSYGSSGPVPSGPSSKTGSDFHHLQDTQAALGAAVTSYLSGVFSTDAHHSRTLYVEVPHGPQNGVSANAFLGDLVSSKLVNDMDMKDFALRGFFIVSFYDIRDAFIACERAKKFIPGARVVFLNALGKAWRNPLLDQPDAVFGAPGIPSFEGQIAVSASCLNVTMQERSPSSLEVFTKNLVAVYGIKASQCLDVSTEGITMRIELFDVRPTYGEIFDLINGKRVGSFYVTVCRFETWLHDPDSNGYIAHQAKTPKGLRREYQSSGSSQSPFTQNDASSGVYALERRQTHYQPSNYASQPSPEYSYAPVSRVARGQNFPNGHNQVNLDRIRAGLDVRTTIMLRNIPNKVTHSMLKLILDQTSLGQYDFMYLRIDFANNCNVGYAFINFADPIHIVAFATARAGQRWNAFNSDKVAEISYATIQGKDCLVSKFRNSSVMLEQPDYRPKLYRTGNGPDAGQPEEFPKPDNYMKMRRSCENAAHVAHLLTCQHFRAEQRHRQSQYDRGTIAAQAEAAATGYRALCCSCGQYHLDGTCAGPSNFRRFA